MKYEETNHDPFGILASAKMVVDGAKYVKISQNAIGNAAKIVENELANPVLTDASQFGSAGCLEDDIQLIFLEDSVNFCFWPQSSGKRWRVVLDGAGGASGGWYSLVNCFKRALRDGIPIIDSRYLANLGLNEAAKIFKGDDGTDIPLLKERIENLRQAGAVLTESFEGRFSRLLEKAGFDAVKIVGLVRDNFASFRDEAMLDGNKITFLKRAQICASDLSNLEGQYPGFKITNLEKLTAFADYRLPQVLREFKVIEYATGLADEVDNLRPIPAGSREEIEIRCATIYAVELLKQVITAHDARLIDNALWTISQKLPQMKPHHRTCSVFY